MRPHTFLLLLGTCLFSRVLAGPLEFFPAVIELGSLAQQQQRNLIVTVRNSGSIPIQILSAHADCSCTVPEIAIGPLPAGASTEMSVSFDSRTFVGEIQRHITLTTDQGTAGLVLNANVTPYDDWIVSPLPVVLPRSPTQHPTSTEVRLTYTGEGTVHIKSVTSNQPWLTAELLSKAPGQTFQLRLTKSADAPVGTHTVSVALRLDSPHSPMLTLRVQVSVVSALRLSPSPLIMPRTPVGEVSRLRVKLTGWSGDDLPHFELPRGEMVALGEDDGALIYELTVTAEQIGSRSFPLHVLRHDQVELDVPVLVRATPTAAAPAAP